MIEIKNKINEIKETARDNIEFEILFIKYFGHNLENLEQEKKNKLKEFIENKFKELIREELPEKWQEIWINVA